jgi:predicted DCC family thiol-disulfide oxidoreductase YuxK
MQRIGLPGADRSVARATLIYDGRCGFCRRWIERARRWDRHGRLDFVPYQTPDFAARFPGVSRDACTRAMHLVTEVGDVHRGAAAGREVLSRLPGGRLWALPLRAPGALAIAERVYTFITRRWGPVSR